MRHRSAVSLAAFAVFATAAFSAGGDWVTVGGDPGHTKYSPLKQINVENVSRLAPAWTFQTGGSEVTPIVIDGVVHYPRGSKITALDGATGEVTWQADLNALVPYSPEAATNAARAPGLSGGRGGRGGPATGPSDNRFLRLGTSAKYGVSYWSGDGKTAPRIVVATTGGYLVQLDAKKGALYKDFGRNGALDLRVNSMEKFSYTDYTPGMLPTLYKNLAIVSLRTGEQGRYGPPGDARAFDLNTGAEVWRFHTLRAELQQRAAGLTARPSLPISTDIVSLRPLGNSLLPHRPRRWKTGRTRLPFRVAGLPGFGEAPLSAERSWMFSSCADSGRFCPFARLSKVRLRYHIFYARK